ncbi:MAG TPA: SsrA-binding protein [Elusimicrobia bacterium]|nr:SsrA-binding protein [Elusimicrobiota bacterium]
MNKKIIATNRKARFNYEILETYEAGIVLTGGEVKSVRAGQVDFKDSYVTIGNSNIEKGEVFLYNINITPYKYSAGGFEKEYNSQRPRKLLLHKNEITKLKNKIVQQRLAVIPLEVYLKNGLVKIEIAVAKGKKTFDKRESIKKREVQREMERS